MPLYFDDVKQPDGALEGTGSLINLTFGTAQSLPGENTISITNSGSHCYVSVETVDGSTLYFETGSKLALLPFSDIEADGVVAETGLGNVAGTTDGSYFGWTAGNNEYRFYATSSSPLPSDNLIYKSPDNNKKLYNYYAEWSGTAATLARNIADKINDINVDGLEELNAAFTNFGFINLKTSIGTNKYNGVVIYRNTSQFITMNHAGRNAYPTTGGPMINGNVKSTTSPTAPVPFIAKGTKAVFSVPNTFQFKDSRMLCQFKAVAGTIAPNTFRVRSTGGDNVQVQIYGE